MAGRSLTFKTLVLASGRVIGALSAVAATAILTRALSVEGYATHKQALLLYGLVAPLLTLGLPKALYYFLPSAPGRGSAALVENLGLLAAGGVLFAVALPLGVAEVAARAFDNPELASVALWMAPYAIAMGPLAALGACLVASDRVGALVKFNIGSRAVLLAAVAVAALVVGEAWATVGAYAAWAVVAVVPAVWLMRRAVRAVAAEEGGAGGAGRASWAGLRAQLAFSVPLGLASLLGTVSKQLDKLIVSAMCSTEVFAIYVTGALELPLIGVVTGAMSAVVLPELTRFHQAGTPEKIVALWQRAMNLAMAVLAPVMFAVLLLGPELMTVLFSARYAEAATPLRIYALMLPLRSAVYGSVLMATDNTRWVTASAALGLVLNAGLSVVLVWAVGYTGAAWATVGCAYVVVAFMLWPMSRALRCRARELIAWRRLGRVLVAAGVPAAVAWAVMAWDGMDGWAAWVRLGVIGGGYGMGVVMAYAIGGVATPRELWGFVRRRGQRRSGGDVE